MFHELAPYLRHRAVLLTVTHLGDDQIRVNVVPSKLKDGENEALTTPLSITGTAEELDADLPKTLVDYVGAHLQLKNSLASAKAQMDAAAKAAQDEARGKAKSTANGGKTQPAGQSNAKPADTDKPAEAPEQSVPRSPSLFDLSPAPAPARVTSAASAPVAKNESEEDEILAEIEEPEAADDLEDAA